MNTLIRIITRMMAVAVASPYVSAPFQSDFDHRDAPESPPMTAITVASTADTVDDELYDTMTDEVIEMDRAAISGISEQQSST